MGTRDSRKSWQLSDFWCRAYQLLAVSASGLGRAELGQINRAWREGVGLQKIKEDHLCPQRRPKPSPLPAHTQEPESDCL